MRKRVAVLLAALMLIVTVSAQTPSVSDHEGLLKQMEVTELERLFGEFYTQNGICLAAVTTDSFYGMTAADYASRCYSDSDYSNDGILLLVSQTQGQWYLYTSGICTQVISDADAARIGGQLSESLEAGSFYDACVILHRECTESIRQLQAEQEKAAAQQKTYELLGMGAGLLVGIFVAVLLGKSAKHPQRRKPAVENRVDN